MVRFLIVVGLVGCGGDAAETTEPALNCNRELLCDDTAFCLVVASEDGVEIASCEPLPEGCDDFEAMCIDEPACVVDWAATFCPDAVLTVCTTGVGTEQAYCSGG